MTLCLWKSIRYRDSRIISRTIYYPLQQIKVYRSVCHNFYKYHRSVIFMSLILFWGKNQWKTSFSTDFAIYSLFLHQFSLSKTHLCRSKWCLTIWDKIAVIWLNPCSLYFLGNGSCSLFMFGCKIFQILCYNCACNLILTVKNMNRIWIEFNSLLFTPALVFWSIVDAITYRGY